MKRGPLFLFLTLCAGALFATPQLQPDLAAGTDDRALMIDVLANDSNADGRPMILQSFTAAPDCPGGFQAFTDGTLVFTPTSVTGTRTCRVDYTVDVNGQTYDSYVDLTVTPGAGGGGGGGGGGGSGGLVPLPDGPNPSCPDSEAHAVCCWHELLRALDGQTDLDWNTLDTVIAEHATPNKTLVCQAAAYASGTSRTMSDGRTSRDFFAQYLAEQKQHGWMSDDGNVERRNEIFSPLYGTWHAAAYMVALDRARSTGDTALVADLESWLRTYWASQALVAHKNPLTSVTVETTITQCDEPSGTYVFSDPQPGWNGMVVGHAGTRRLSSSCGPNGSTPTGVLVPASQPGHFLTALALDTYPRQWTSTGLAFNTDGSMSTYFNAVRAALRLQGTDFLAAQDGTADLEAQSLDAALFGLTEAQRQDLADFVADPAADSDRLERLVSYLDQDWRPALAKGNVPCAMSFERTTTGTLSRFGVDDGANGGAVPVCNLNTPPIYATTILDTGHAEYLSPGAPNENDTVERKGNQICAATGQGEVCIDRPGGSVLYRVEWTASGWSLVTNNLPDPVDPPQQSPYGGTAHALPGRVEAEHYDEGGSNVAWSDATAANTGANPFRPAEGVDVHTFSPGRVAIVDTAVGEWVEFTVDVAQAGDYALSVEYRAVAPGDGRLRAELLGTGVSRELVLPNRTTDWDFAHLLDVTGVPAGEHVLRLTVLDDGVELDGFWLHAMGETRAPYGGQAASLPGTLQVERYDEGDPGDAYFDTTPWNLGNVPFRGDDWVDAQVLGSDVAVSWITAGEWLEYSVTVAEAGIYDVEARFLSDRVGTFRISQVGGAGTSVTLPNSSNLPQVAEVASLTLGAGSQILRLDFDTNGYSLDWLRLTRRAEEVEAPTAVDDLFYLAETYDNGTYLFETIWSSWVKANDVIPGTVSVYRPVGSPNPACGQLQDHIGGWKFTVTAGCETASWLYELSDPDTGLTDQATVTLRIVPEPVGQANSFAVAHGQSLTIDAATLLADDDGRGLGLVFLPETVTQPGAGGTVTVLAGNQLRFDPAPGFWGNATFTYQARNDMPERNPIPTDSDWKITSDPVTVTVTVAPPALQPADDVFRVPAGSTFVDLPFDGLWRNDGSALPLEMIGFGGPTHGTVIQLADRFRFYPDPAFFTAGTDQMTYTARYASGGTAATATVSLWAEPACDGGFAHDFEDGLLSAWTQQLELDGGTVEAVSAAALEGSLGLRVSLPAGATSARLGELTLQGSDYPRVAFLLNADGVQIDEGHIMPIAAVGNALILQLSKRNGEDSLRLMARTDDAGFQSSAWTALGAGSQRVEIESRIATGPATADGRSRLFLDGFLRGEIGNLNNFGDPARNQRALIGALWGVGNTTGTLSFDDYRSCRGPSDRQSVLIDGFEDQTLNAWDLENTSTGGSFTVSPGVALEGAQGLSVQVDPGTTWLRLGSTEAANAPHLVGGLLLDPTGMVIPEGENIYLTGLLGSGGWTYNVRLGYAEGSYRLLQVAPLDGGAWANGPWIELTGTPPYRLGFEILRAQQAGSLDGAARLWVDGVLVDELTGLDNDGRIHESFFLGSAGNEAASGSYTVDSVQLWAPTP